MNSMWTDLNAWLAKPFNDQGSALQWFAFIGLLLVSIWLWHMIARDFMRISAD